MNVSRRTLFAATGSFTAAALLLPLPSVADPASLSPALLRRALDALDRHGAAIPNRDVIAIADFSLPSRTPRFYLLDVANARVLSSHLVAHGRGSDPDHTGWLQRFSNEPSSNATSAGAYRTDGLYIGEHGRSIRLTGLDTSNNNALERAIVVHAAWYVSPQMARTYGVLGRSEGCFALSDTSLPEVLAQLGPGHLIYADKV
ncbi:MAG TPA: murein L,D-transpeptidase catalytic domain family protein [Rhizomicrobium sp.]|nr:murein L,D-transpeptidase catalytic domain family protein [Rhizomicrobium sp.]